MEGIFQEYDWVPGLSCKKAVYAFLRCISYRENCGLTDTHLPKTSNGACHKNKLCRPRVFEKNSANSSMLQSAGLSSPIQRPQVVTFPPTYYIQCSSTYKAALQSSISTAEDEPVLHPATYARDACGRGCAVKWLCRTHTQNSQPSTRDQT